jgi:YVTN family beta-propeller protein
MAGPSGRHRSSRRRPGPLARRRSRRYRGRGGRAFADGRRGACLGGGRLHHPRRHHPENGVAADPAAGTVYVANVNDDTVSVIDTATNTVTATIPVGSHPIYVAADPAAGTVYVTNVNDDTVSVINAATNTVTATIPVGSGPVGVATDPAAGTVYVTNQGDDTVSVINAATNTVTATTPVGTTPAGVAVDPSTHTAYVANAGDDTVSVISPDLPVPVTTVTSSQDPSTFGQKSPSRPRSPRPTAAPSPLPTAPPCYATPCPSPTPAAAPTKPNAPPPPCRPGSPPSPPPTRRHPLRRLRGHAHPDRRPGPDRPDRQLPHRAKGTHSHRRLTASGSPVSGQPVSFSTGTTQLCTPDTSTKGMATCTLTAAQTVLAEHDHDPILASYPGNANYQPSSATLTPP